MSTIGNDISRGVRDLERQTGNPVVAFKGTNIPCVANQARASKLLGLGGFQLEADLTLFVRTEELPGDHETNGPKEKQTWVYRGRTYRIDHKTLLPGDSVYEFGCNDPSKGV